MSRRFVITRAAVFDSKPLICAVYEDHQMLEVNCIPQDAPPQILNNIYVARVSQVVKNIGAAFVEIEKGRKCFLPLADVKNPVYVKRMSKAKVLSQGDELLVQVTREAVKTKDPQVTTNLSLAGIYSVVTSADRRLGVSGKLEEGEREQLRKLAQTVYDERLGVVVRTNAAKLLDGDGQEQEALTAEIAALQKQMHRILSHAPYRSMYSLIFKAPPEYIRLLQNQPLDQLSKIVTDDEAVYGELAVLAENYPSMMLENKLELYTDTSFELHKLYSVQVQLEQALQKKIWLKSGANLLIEPTEALTVIDVNSSKSTKKKLPEEHHLQVNLEAAQEIARQLRLRNISGIIIIDFIDMKSAQHQEALLEKMRTCVKSDPVKTQVIDLTRLGLMELTRQKTRRPLWEQLTKKL